MEKSFGLEQIIGSVKLIETKHKNGNDWVVTVILNSYSDFIEIKQVKDYLTSVVMVGDKLVCKIIDKENIHLMDAEVYNVKFTSRSIVLRIESIKSIRNKRKMRRYDVNLSSSFNIHGMVGESYGVVVDIAKCGIGMVSRKALDLGEKITLSIYFSEFDHLTAECTIKWCNLVDENYNYGLVLDEMDEISKAKYGDLIRKVQRKESKLRKKGKNLL